jgi:hypothetical protein
MGMGGQYLSGGLAKGCWVAAELYGGWYADETVLIRCWLRYAWYMRPFALFYSWMGERWAKAIRKKGLLRAGTKMLFDFFLVIANGRR